VIAEGVETVDQHPSDEVYDVLEDLHVRFYAGVPRSSAGFSYGTLCVVDVIPRQLSGSQRAGLIGLARQVTTRLEHRQTINELSLALRKCDLAVSA